MPPLHPCLLGARLGFGRGLHRKPETAIWQIFAIPVPLAHRAVAEQAETLVVRSPERERRDLRKLDNQQAEITAALAEDDRSLANEVLHPLLRDKKLKRLVRVTADKKRVEPDLEAVETARRRLNPASLEGRVERVNRALAKGRDAEVDGSPHPLLQNKGLRSLVRRTADGLQVELNEEAVAQARARTAPTAIDAAVTAIREALAVQDLRVVATVEHSLLRNPKLKPLVRVSGDGRRVEVDADVVAERRERAGLRALRTTAIERSAAALLRAYDDLLVVEATFRTFKDVLDIRPMYHRAEPRIRAHAMVCVLAQRCMHWIEETSGRSWAEIMKIFARVQATEMSQGSATWWQRNELSEEAVEVLAKLGFRPGPERWASKKIRTVLRTSAEPS
jgi:hypothetical protein